MAVPLGTRMKRSVRSALVRAVARLFALVSAAPGSPPTSRRSARTAISPGRGRRGDRRLHGRPRGGHPGIAAEWVWMHERWKTRPEKGAGRPLANTVPKTAELSSG
jgi:hypothetical protein